MADLIPGDSSKQSDNIRIDTFYEPRQEDISDLRLWGIKKYDREGGYAEVRRADHRTDRTGFFLSLEDTGRIMDETAVFFFFF